MGRVNLCSTEGSLITGDRKPRSSYPHGSQAGLRITVGAGISPRRPPAAPSEHLGGVSAGPHQEHGWQPRFVPAGSETFSLCTCGQAYLWPETSCRNKAARQGVASPHTAPQWFLLHPPPAAASWEPCGHRGLAQPSAARGAGIPLPDQRPALLAPPGTLGAHHPAWGFSPR